jgi:hypothetical protein
MVFTLEVNISKKVSAEKQNLKNLLTLDGVMHVSKE